MGRADPQQQIDKLSEESFRIAVAMDGGRGTLKAAEARLAELRSGERGRQVAAVRDGAEGTVTSLAREIREAEAQIAAVRGVLAAQQYAREAISSEVGAIRLGNPDFFRKVAHEASERVRALEGELVAAVASLERAETDASTAWGHVRVGPRGGPLIAPARDFDGLRYAVARLVDSPVLPPGEEPQPAGEEPQPAGTSGASDLLEVA